MHNRTLKIMNEKLIAKHNVTITDVLIYSNSNKRIRKDESKWSTITFKLNTPKSTLFLTATDKEVENKMLIEDGKVQIPSLAIRYSVENTLSLILLAYKVQQEEILNIKYTKEHIKDSEHRLDKSQEDILLTHCNKYKIEPNICAWYTNMEAIYDEWVLVDKICKTKEDAKRTYKEKREQGEFKAFRGGNILRLKAKE